MGGEGEKKADVRACCIDFSTPRNSIIMIGLGLRLFIDVFSACSNNNRVSEVFRYDGVYFWRVFCDFGSRGHEESGV